MWVWKPRCVWWQWRRAREKGASGWVRGARCGGGGARDVQERARVRRRVARARASARPRHVRVMRADRAALLAWLVCCAAALSSHKYSTRVVRTKYGPLRGIVVHSHPQVEAYLGVPYATPPLGSLRWEFHFFKDLCYSEATAKLNLNRRFRILEITLMNIMRLNLSHVVILN